MKDAPCLSYKCQCDRCRARLDVWLQHAKAVCPTYPDGWTGEMGDRVYQEMKSKGIE